MAERIALDAESQEPLSLMLQAIGRSYNSVTKSASGAVATVNSTNLIRKFLLFTLVTDYKAALPGVGLTAQEQEHYLTLNDFFHLTTRGSGSHRHHSPISTLPLQESDSLLLQSYLTTTLFTPAYHLKIPVDLIIAAIHRFAAHRRSLDGAYAGCLSGLELTEGLHTVAVKIYLDRRFIIPRITSEGARAQIELLTAIQKYQQRYFSAVEGFDSVVLLPKEHSFGHLPHQDQQQHATEPPSYDDIKLQNHPDGIYSWCLATYDGYTLNEEGHKFQERYQKSAKLVVFLDWVKGCVGHMKEAFNTGYSSGSEPPSPVKERLGRPTR